MHTKGGKSQTEETEAAQTYWTAQREWQMLCYRMGYVLFMNRQQISVFGVKRLCVRSVWAIQIKVTAIWSRWPQRRLTPQQLDDRTHSVKADKGWTNTRQHAHTSHSLSHSQCVRLCRLWRRTWWRRGDKLCVCLRFLPFSLIKKFGGSFSSSQSRV